LLSTKLGKVGESPCYYMSLRCNQKLMQWVMISRLTIKNYTKYCCFRPGVFNLFWFAAPFKAKKNLQHPYFAKNGYLCTLITKTLIKKALLKRHYFEYWHFFTSPGRHHCLRQLGLQTILNKLVCYVFENSSNLKHIQFRHMSM